MKEIFLAACDRPPRERAAMLEQECAGDAELHARVTALLSQHDAAGPEPATEPGPGSLQAGQVFAGRYRIVSRVAVGGMGEVYRADDLTLGVPVALKLPRADDHQRRALLLQEARLAREVSHPAVCRVFDVGEAEGRLFLTMEWIDGEDLASHLRRMGALPPPKVLDLARELCAGLAAAHERGVLHRDLKPANVMVDADGHARIVDFGIAIRDGARAGLPVGTPAYMAPEQLEPDAPVGERTDLYALGLLLFELLTGAALFRASDLDELKREHGEVDAAPLLQRVLHVDPRLEALVLRATRENPAQRPASAREMLDALVGNGAPQRRRRRSTLVAVAGVLLAVFLLARPPALEIASPSTERPLAVAPRTAIAVLPFADLEGGEQEPLADGLTEEIMGALSRLPELQVAARTSSFRFKGHAEDVRSIATKLGVGTVLDGSVRVSGDRIRISAQLIEAASGFQLWSETYDRGLEDVFAVQDQIAHAIASELEVRLAADRRLVRPAPRNLRAYRLVLEAHSLWNERTDEAFDRALALYERATEIDPGYARAWSGIGDVLVSMAIAWPNEARSAERLERAETAVRRAVALDPESAAAHASLAHLVEYRHRDYDAARAGYLRALELNPGWVNAHSQLGILDMKLGRLEEGRAHVAHALELDPLSAYLHRQLGRCAYYEGNPEEAVRHLRRGLEQNPRDPDIPRLLWAAYQTMDRPVLAREAYLRRAEPWQRPPARAMARVFGQRAVLGSIVALGLLVQPAEAGQGGRGLLERGGSWNLALALAWLGDSERMFEHLDRAAEHDVAYLLVEPVFDPYRDDPRFEAVLQRAGLLDAAMALRDSESP